MSEPDRRCRICRRPQDEGGVCDICREELAKAQKSAQKPPLCSICRRRHGLEIIHACE